MQTGAVVDAADTHYYASISRTIQRSAVALHKIYSFSTSSSVTADGALYVSLTQGDVRRRAPDIRLFPIVFPGDLRKAAVKERLRAICEKLDGPKGILRRFTPAGMDIDSVIQILTVFASPRLDVEKASLPQILKPKKSPYGVPGKQLVYASELSWR